MITAVVLLTAIGSVALYTVHIANAQSNTTSAGGAKNMTAGSNTTGAAGNTTGSNMTGASGSSIPTAKPAGSKLLNPDDLAKLNLPNLSPIIGGKK